MRTRCSCMAATEKPKCVGTNRRGGPCGRAPLKGKDFCLAHPPDTEEYAAIRFGSPEQAAAAATGVERRYPRLREVIEREIEDKAERIVGAQIEALEATRITVNEETGEVHVHPDFAIRLRAGDTLVSRALGRPGSEQTINVDARSIHFDFDLNDEQLATVHGLLRGRPAIAASVER